MAIKGAISDFGKSPSLIYLLVQQLVDTDVLYVE